MTTRLATYLLPALVGLSATGSAQSVPAPCREAAASFALGETYTDRLARQARRAAEARIVRKVEPGRAHTMEFRADRLNLDVDGRGIVLAVRCG